MRELQLSCGQLVDVELGKTMHCWRGGACDQLCAAFHLTSDFGEPKRLICLAMPGECGQMIGRVPFIPATSRDRLVAAAQEYAGPAGNVGWMSPIEPLDGNVNMRRFVAVGNLAELTELVQTWPWTRE